MIERSTLCCARPAANQCSSGIALLYDNDCQCTEWLASISYEDMAYSYRKLFESYAYHQCQTDVRPCARWAVSCDMQRTELCARHAPQNTHPHIYPINPTAKYCGHLILIFACKMNIMNNNSAYSLFVPSICQAWYPRQLKYAMLPSD